MRPRLGKYTKPARVRQCHWAKGCPICGMCQHYRQSSVKCRECYQKRGTKTARVRCICPPQTIALANSISRRLDRPMWDLNGNAQQVNVVSDPAAQHNDILKNAIYENGV